MRARLLYGFKENQPNGDVIEVVIWGIPADFRHVEGIRYRLVFIPCGHRSPAVLYDNHHPKGHHKHVDGRELSYEFVDALSLRRDFLKDVEIWREKRERRC